MLEHFRVAWTHCEKSALGLRRQQQPEKAEGGAKRPIRWPASVSLENPLEVRRGDGATTVPRLHVRALVSGRVLNVRPYSFPLDQATRAKATKPVPIVSS